MARSTALVLSAEHASGAVPERYLKLFDVAAEVLATHRAIDAGTLEIGRRFARAFGVPLHAATATRLLVDCNRSPRHPRLFSEFTRHLTPAEREQIIAEHYTPLRDAVRQATRTALRDATPTLHLSLHSFSPVLDGRVRDADVGLLYDPAREAERELCGRWQHILQQTGLRVRRNYPYRGVSDGHVTALRREFATMPYRGVELEINQRLVTGDRRTWTRLQRSIVASLAPLLQQDTASDQSRPTETL